MPAPSTRIRSTHSSDGGIVLDVDRGRMFSLNGSGSAIFELLAKGVDEKTIIDELGRRFEIPVAVAKQDLDEFREALKCRGVLPGLRDVSRE